MSLINKVLQDLDRRQALATAGEAPAIPVRASAPPQPAGRQWFWAAIGVLAAAGIVWIGWVAYQLTPRSLATPVAFQAAAELAQRAAQPPTALSVSPPPAASIAASPTLPPSAASAEPLAPPLAQAIPPAEAPAIARPVEPPAPRAAVAESPVAVPEPPAPKPKPAPRSEVPREPKTAPQRQAIAAVPAPATAAPGPVVDKRDSGKSGAEVAEGHFRRAAGFLNQGRISEAEDQLISALRADPSHQASRQAYVSLLLEQRRVDAARRVLAEALAGNPAQPTFALALARILADQRDYAGALEVMDRAGSVSRNADFQALRGVVLQRINRHGEAVEAFQNATRGGVQAANTWVALGISLEALGRKGDAAQAYRRALGAGSITSELRDYAENRARALE